jgi:hypothetical protein
VTPFCKLGSGKVLSHFFLVKTVWVWTLTYRNFSNFFSHGTVADVSGLPAAPDPFHAAYYRGFGTPRTLNCPRQNPDRYALAIVFTMCYCYSLFSQFSLSFTVCHCYSLFSQFSLFSLLFTVIHCFSLLLTVFTVFTIFTVIHCYSLFLFSHFCIIAPVTMVIK